MKAIGFSLRQKVQSAVSGAVLMAATGTLIGASVGFLFAWRLFLSLAQDDGVPPDFVQFPTPPWLEVFIPIAAVIAVLSAALPARRAAALPVADALRYE